MRSTDFPFAVMPQRFDKGGPSFADRARTVAKGATFAFNDEIEAGLRALAQLDPAAYQREVARIRAQQAAYEAANPYESAGLEIGGALLPALLPGGQGLAAARMASLAVKAPRAARIAPVVGEAALYGIGAADSMADIPSSVLSEGAQALGMYGVGAAAAPRLKALGSKLAARLRPSKGTAPPAMAVKPQALPAPEAPLAVKPQGITAYHGSPHTFDQGVLDERRSLDQMATSGLMGTGQPTQQAVNPMPETNLSIREQAEQFANRLRALGVEVGDIQHSVNRHGQNSAYIATQNGQLRISDHDANMDFRPGQIAIYDTSESGVQQFVERAQHAQAEGAARRASAAEIQAAHEEPFIQRFLAAPEHERHSIILEAYPELSGPHFKQKRQELLRRWRHRDRQQGG